MKPFNWFIVFSVLIVFSCKPKKPSWESEYLTPLIKTNVQLDQIVNDTLLQKNEDNSVTLVYKQQLGEFATDSLVELPNNTFEKNTKLSTLDLSDISFEADITLGMIAQNWPFWGPIIIGANGGSYPFPDICCVSSGPHPADIQDIFESATFASGFMDITVTNNFACDVSNLTYELDNAVSGANFISHSFPYLAQGSTESVTFDLTGKTLEGSIEATLVNIDFLFGGDSILVDTSDALDVYIVIRDMQIQTATAIFPSQEIINDKITTKLKLDEAKLTSTTLSAGEIIIDVESTAQDTVFFTYSIPGALSNGSPFFVNTKVPPATANSNSSASFVYDFSNYTMDLTGESGDKTNEVYSEFTGRIDSTGIMVTLSENDSLYVNLRLENLKPSSIKGFLGTYSFNSGLSKAPFDVYKKVISGNLNIENISSTISVDNGFGVNGEFSINQFEGHNSKNNEIAALSGSILSTPLTINKASSLSSGATISDFELSNANSNIADVLAIMPDQFVYDISLDLNKGIDSSTTDFQDFADAESKIRMGINTKIPLSVIAEELKLRDTIEFSKESRIELEGVKAGKLFMIVDNGFPLNCDLNVSFFNFNYTELTKIQSNQVVEAGNVTNGKVSGAKRSVIEYDLAEGDIDKMLDADYVIISAKFNSESSDYVDIYSDYILGITLSGKFTY